MIIDTFILPSAEDELDWELSGGACIGMPSASRSILPFGLFPKKSLSKIDLKSINVFCGGSNSEALLLTRVIASKLGNSKLPNGMSQRCLLEYLSMCGVRYSTVDKKNAFNLIHITAKDRDKFLADKYASFDTDRNWSVVRFFDELISPSSFVIIEDPEIGMSLSDMKEFVLYVQDMCKYNGCQFLILSNSPVVLGIKNAVIYDFDKTPVVSNMWCNSSIAAEHSAFYEELYTSHTQNIK